MPLKKAVELIPLQRDIGLNASHFQIDSELIYRDKTVKISRLDELTVSVGELNCPFRKAF